MFLGIIIEVKPLRQKAEMLIDVTDSGIVKDFSPLQFRNKPSAIDVIEFGSEISDNSVQPLKADSPIYVTELGSDIDDNAVQP